MPLCCVLCVVLLSTHQMDSWAPYVHLPQLHTPPMFLVPVVKQ